MIKFTIPGKPEGKGRPRFRRAGNYVQTYTPDKTKVYENLVKLAFTQAAPPGFKPYEKDVPLEISITACFTPPESVSRKKKAEMLRGVIYPTKVPDVDNICKSIMDSLHDVCYVNDCSVVKMSVDKRYSEVPEAIVTIEELKTEKENEQ